MFSSRSNVSCRRSTVLRLGDDLRPPPARMTGGGLVDLPDESEWSHGDGAPARHSAAWELGQVVGIIHHRHESGAWECLSGVYTLWAVACYEESGATGAEEAESMVCLDGRSPELALYGRDVAGAFA